MRDKIDHAVADVVRHSQFYSFPFMLRSKWIVTIFSGLAPKAFEADATLLNAAEGNAQVARFDPATKCSLR